MEKIEQSNILEQVRKIMLDVIEIEAEAIQLEASLRDDLHADSLASVEIVMALEDVFGIQISEQQAKSLQTVGDLVQAIANALPASDAAQNLKAA